LFWSGDFVDANNSRRLRQGLERALGSLLELGWECIGRDIQIGPYMHRRALIRKPMEGGPTYEFIVTGGTLIDGERKNWFSKSEDISLLTITQLSPTGARVITNERVTPESESSRMQALIDDYISDGWQEVGEPWSTDRTLVRPIVNQGNDNGGDMIPDQSRGQDQDPLMVLERLAKLKDTGAISEDEYEQKKTELLSRL